MAKLLCHIRIIYLVDDISKMPLPLSLWGNNNKSGLNSRVWIKNPSQSAIWGHCTLPLLKAAEAALLIVLQRLRRAVTASIGCCCCHDDHTSQRAAWCCRGACCHYYHTCNKTNQKACWLLEKPLWRYTVAAAVMVCT